MSDTKISVVVPCYNVEQYIRRGLDSILAQTMQEWEAILVDDGATDSTGAICEEYAKDSRFRVIHQENQGVSSARNNGMKEAMGELLYFMDPDDWIEPDCFGRCYDIYMENGYDMIQFEKYWVYGESKNPDKGTVSGVWNHEQIIETYTGPLIGVGLAILNSWYKGGNLWSYKKNLGIWCFMFRRQFIECHNLFFQPELKMFEDVLFAVESSIYAEKLVSIPDCLYNYNVRDEGTVIRRTNIPEGLFTDKYNLLEQRARLRSLIKEYDLHDYYLGSHVLSCLQLALKTSDKWDNYKLYCQYVTHPDVQESIKKVSLKGAPLKFSLPVRLLKLHGHKLLFAGCWLLHKMGVADRVSM